MQTTATRYSVRPMDLGDISQVMEIEKDSFPSMWPSTAFKREIRHNRLARYLVAVEHTVQEGETLADAPGPTAPAAQPLSPPRHRRTAAHRRYRASPDERTRYGEPGVSGLQRGCHRPLRQVRIPAAGHPPPLLLRQPRGRDHHDRRSHRIGALSEALPPA